MALSNKQVCCPHCFITNRVPVEKMADSPICGKCRLPLFAAKPTVVDTPQLSKMLSKNDIPVLVDFWAEWCGPCKQMAPEFQTACEQQEPRIRYCKVDTQLNQALASQYAIRGIPALILFNNGKEVNRMTGMVAASAIVEFVTSSLA